MVSKALEEDGRGLLEGLFEQSPGDTISSAYMFDFPLQFCLPGAL
jgi:hypothetical protein